MVIPEDFRRVFNAGKYKHRDKYSQIRRADYRVNNVDGKKMVLYELIPL